MENVPNAKANGVLTKGKQKTARIRETVVQFSETDEKRIVGPFNAQGPPVPIPNTEVKLCGAENTRREAVREDRARPTFYIPR